MKRILSGLAALLLAFPTGAQTFHWETVPVRGRLTGVRASNTENVEQTMGKVAGRTFYAPNGRRYRGGVVWKAARLMIEAQPGMADIKTVIGRSTRRMHKGYPESALGNWFVDNVMAECAARTGRKVDFGIVNYGGIRIDMPEGDIFKDDILSMFPFKNSVVYLRLKGGEVRAILEEMAAKGFQQLGGVECTVRDRRLESVKVGGRELDDDAEYGLATISFLLDGGDGLFLGKHALEKIDLYETDGLYVYDLMLEVVKRAQAEGRPIEYGTDGRVRIYNKEGVLLTSSVKK